MSMNSVFFVIITIMTIIIGLDMLNYFLTSKTKKGNDVEQSNLTHQPEVSHQEGELIVIEVAFKGYKGNYMYGVEQANIYKGQYVLVLTRDGIRCAEVVADSKVVKQNQLKVPHFLLENIICVADEVDLEYYK